MKINSVIVLLVLISILRCCNKPNPCFKEIKIFEKTKYIEITPDTLFPDVKGYFKIEIEDSICNIPENMTLEITHKNQDSNVFIYQKKSDIITPNKTKTIIIKQDFSTNSLLKSGDVIFYFKLSTQLDPDNSIYCMDSINISIKEKALPSPPDSIPDIFVTNEYLYKIEGENKFLFEYTLQSLSNYIINDLSIEITPVNFDASFSNNKFEKVTIQPLSAFIFKNFNFSLINGDSSNRFIFRVIIKSVKYRKLLYEKDCEIFSKDIRNAKKN